MASSTYNLEDTIEAMQARTRLKSLAVLAGGLIRRAGASMPATGWVAESATAYDDGGIEIQVRREHGKDALGSQTVPDSRMACTTYDPDLGWTVTVSE